MTSFSTFRWQKKIKKNLCKVLNTFEHIMENEAFGANAPFSIIFSNTSYFKGVIIDLWSKGSSWIQCLIAQSYPAPLLFPEKIIKESIFIKRSVKNWERPRKSLDLEAKAICVFFSVSPSCNVASTLCLLVPSVDNICKQFGPRSGPTKCRAWPGSKLFDTLMVFLKEFYEKVEIEKNQQKTKKPEKLPIYRIKESVRLMLQQNQKSI